MTEQEQAVVFLKKEWNRVLKKIQNNRGSLDSNLMTLRKYCTLRDSFIEIGFDVKEAKEYEAENPLWARE